MLGLFMFVTALYTVITNRPSRIGLSSRQKGALALAASSTLAFTGTLVGVATMEPAPKEQVAAPAEAAVVPVDNTDPSPEVEGPDAVAEEQCPADEQAAAAIKLAAVEKAAADKKAADKVIFDKKAADKAAAVKKAESKIVADRKVAQAKVAAYRRAAKAVPTPLKTSPASS